MKLLKISYYGSVDAVSTDVRAFFNRTTGGYNVFQITGNDVCVCTSMVSYQYNTTFLNHEKSELDITITTVLGYLYRDPKQPKWYLMNKTNIFKMDPTVL